MYEGSSNDMWEGLHGFWQLGRRIYIYLICENREKRPKRQECGNRVEVNSYNVDKVKSQRLDMIGDKRANNFWNVKKEQHDVGLGKKINKYWNWEF